MEEINQVGMSQAEMYQLDIAELTKEKYILIKRIKELTEEIHELQRNGST
tara:strand:+ start:44 stop:193 length:150 start_codon:yes stop_codon:yes gene_type:complete